MTPSHEVLVLACESFTEEVPNGPYFTAAGPTEAALAVLDETSPLSQGEQTIVLMAWAVWNGSGPFGRFMRLDNTNLMRVSLLLDYLATGDLSKLVRACPPTHGHGLGVADRVVTLEEMVTAARAAVTAIDALIAERPQLPAKITGHTTLGNIRAELKSAADRLATVQLTDD